MNARGFSLAELIVVAAVMGLVMAIGMPSFISYWRTSGLKAGAQEMVAVLNQGRELAIKENETVCVKGNSGVGTYGTKVRFLRGNCSAASMCSTTANVSPCIWAGPGTDSSGSITLSPRLEARPSSHVVFTYLGAATTGGTYTVRSIDNTSATATVTVAGSGRINYTF
jgi:prepilin-type N-terminal cleavage/methylation domain-containing protein